MTQGTITKLFPECFPDNIVKTIRDIGREDEIDVYRICLSGKVNKQAFMGTYEAYKEGLITVKDIDPDDVGSYSTSTFKKIHDIKRTYKMFLRTGRYPKAIIIKTKTYSKYGLMQITKERTGTKKSHVAWWIYKNVDPSENSENYEEVAL